MGILEYESTTKLQYFIHFHSIQNFRKPPHFYMILVLIPDYTFRHPPSNTPLGRKTPPEIRRAGAAAYRDSEKLQMLLEQWTMAQGQWQQSDFYIQLKQKKRNRKFGCRKWLTRSEMLAKFGSATVADEIIAAKLHDENVEATQVRAHPDLHGRDTEDRP